MASQKPGNIAFLEAREVRSEDGVGSSYLPEGILLYITLREHQQYSHWPHSKVSTLTIVDLSMSSDHTWIKGKEIWKMRKEQKNNLKKGSMR